MRNFAKVAREKVEIFLAEKGFIYTDGQFVRESLAGVRSMIAFDNGGIDQDSFNIVIFVNSVKLDDDKGAYCVTYFTGGSLSKTPKNIPCNNQDILAGRIERFISSYNEIVGAYLSRFCSISDIADDLSCDQSLSSYRGDLYLLDGEKGKAKKAYKEWLIYIETLKHLDEITISGEIQKTKQKIKKCGFFSRP